MSITATDRGTGSDGTTGTSLVVNGSTMSGNMAAGSTGVLCLAMDNASGVSTNLTATTYTDSVGNVWVVRTTATSGSANLFAETAVLTAYLGVGFTTSSTLTLTFVTTTAAKAWTWIELVPTAGNIVLFVKGSTSGSFNTTSPTMTAQDMVKDDVFIGMGGAESADTWVGDADTTNGTWSTKQSTSTGSGATGMSVISQTKILTAYGDQTWNPTLTIADVRLGWLLCTEADAKARSVSTNNVATETTTNVPVTVPLTAGSIGVLCLSGDNANAASANFPTTLTDSKSNSWTLQQTGRYSPTTANTGVEIGLYTSVLTTGLTYGDTIPVVYTVAGVTAKGWVLWEFAPTGAGPMSYVTGGMGIGATATSNTVTTSSITNGDYVIGLAGSEGLCSLVGDSDTSNGNWVKAAISGIGGSAGTATQLLSQWKQVTATATQTFNVTLNSADNDIGWISVHDASPTGLTAAQKAGFFHMF